MSVFLADADNEKIMTEDTKTVIIPFLLTKKAGCNTLLFLKSSLAAAGFGP